MAQAPIHVHLGAHKTATTYMQSRLRANRKILAEKGIAFADAWAKDERAKKLRSSVAKTLWRKNVTDVARRGLISDLRGLVSAAESRCTSGASGPTIFSYENILGSYNLAVTEGLYERCGEVVDLMSEAFEGREVRYFFCFRSFDRFVESCYLQCLYTQKESRSFDAFFGDINLSSLSWARMIKRLADRAGSDQLFLWAYEDWSSCELDVWKALMEVSNPVQLLEAPAVASNPSLSAEGVECMRVINQFAHAKTAKVLRTQVKREMAPQKGYARASFVDDEARRDLKRRYAEDCDVIHNKWSRRLFSGGLKLEKTGGT
ncbi:hypothetical protein [Natronospira bacteriovora]|uniref:Sulfotransferase domain-containing protein n=1 Tax=Natronospira bacteriovora TaxID=3069753 RepID=A0ABU0W787_9GAMM|nr:hypothetical protein [Natronospira sp. AB-CW4]MDQ2069894.1 hypothetical protein [Natronospira sp. AB-CW4]